ncbi:MAG: hypothetical protein C0484_27780 [Rhodospirillum sp.]|nr:hypothetical protein [Rhodospirillum sp.]
MNLKLNIDIPETALSGIRDIVGADTDDFLELVKVAKLNKKTDFVEMSFDEMNLDGIELDGFDFSGADFRKCSLKGTVFIECQLKGAAFSFPPQVRDKWQSKADFFVGHENTDALNLMRTAEEAPRKEERKEALNELLKIPKEDDITSFLQRISLEDKAKSLRHWLKAKLTGGFKHKEELKAILERSFFEGGDDLEEDISSYVNLMESSDEAVETLCQVCAINSRAIKSASRAVGNTQPFKRLLIKNLSLSADHQIWVESATALRDIDIDPTQKDIAFNLRLLRVKDRHDVASLAKTAAYNNVRNKRLFELCETGYRDTADAWHADDFLLYCYFYDRNKYSRDVLFYSFRQPETSREHISAATAFGAYCFVKEPRLHRSVEDEWASFMKTPSL